MTSNNVYVHSYKSGVVDSLACNDSDDNLNLIDHAVLLVGYGKDETSGLDYWLIKNSWSDTWGDRGYIKVAINDEAYSAYRGGICGVH